MSLIIARVGTWQTVKPIRTLDSFLFPAALVGLILLFTRDHFSEHNPTVALHKCHARQTLAVLEGVAHQWLLRLEGALCHFIGFQRMRFLHFLATCFLTHFPLQLGNATC